MYVYVHSVLAGGAPDVDADVVAVRLVLRVDVRRASLSSASTAACSSAVMSKKSATCRRGTTMTCPEASEWLSSRAYASSFCATTFPGRHSSQSDIVSHIAVNPDVHMVQFGVA